MLTMICEMCGCRDVVKRNGLYVCSRCGTKYSPADARNLIWRLDDEEQLDSGEESSFSEKPSPAGPIPDQQPGARNKTNVTNTESDTTTSLSVLEFTGLFIELFTNGILGAAVLSLITQKAPSAFSGNFADLLFILSGVAAIATLVCSVRDLIGGPSRYTAYCAIICSISTCILAVLNMGDAPIYPIIYLFFSLVNAVFGISRWVKMKSKTSRQ